jgi:hypothetical protein
MSVESTLQHIDEPRLETDLAYRFGYLTDFMGFSEDDIKTIHGAAEVLAPLVPGLVDAVYDKLFTYDATKRHFVPRQSGYEGEVPESLENLTLDHDQIRFRKEHLANYLVKLVTAPYDEKLVVYLDLVGKIHTPGEGSKQINVPLVQMNALMGFVADAFNATIFSLNLPADATEKAVRAFSKLLWLQNDLINRHYCVK